MSVFLNYGGEPKVAGEPPEGVVRGERGLSSVSRVASMQSRVSSVLSVALMAIMCVGMLAWYYTNAITRQTRARRTAQAISTNQAQSEMSLPSFGHIDAPSQTSFAAAEEPLQAARSGNAARTGSRYGMDATDDGGAVGKTTQQLELARQLAGVAFARMQDGPKSLSSSLGSIHSNDPTAPVSSKPVAGGGGAGNETASLSTASTEDRLSESLRSSTTPAVQAMLLPTQRLLLMKGAFIDCTLESAIDSTLPGMTTCITATDTFGVDGKVVLLERGTKLIGETRGQVQQGAARVFVLWTTARTPSGVVVPLDSPGTDELGRSGLPGEVNRHFWARFGAAMLISTINSATQAAVQSASRGSGTVVYSPSASQDVLTEVLKSTLNIEPTVVKHQGDRIQVLVARDLDFRTVYELRATNPR